MANLAKQINQNNAAVMAKRAAVKNPTTQIQGKTVVVTGTKGGAISAAQSQAKAARLQGAELPSSVGKYSGTASIKILPGSLNPHRVGTYRHKAYAAMAACTTAGQYAQTGYKPKYLARWVRLGLIRVS